jgi:5'-3' exonuclease
MIALIDADIIMYRASFKHEGDETFFECSETIDSMMDYIILRTESYEYIGFLTGKGNFRNELALTKEYKGNRKNREKPKWLQEARDYLMEQWECYEVEGAEADDALGICQLEIKDDTIICSIDKDLLQIEGNHFNWNSDTIYKQSKLDAEKLYWKQVLMGDSTDNIVGIPRVGKVKADRILESAEDVAISDGVDVNYSSICCTAYINHYKDVDDAELKMEETIGLVKIARDSDDDRLSEKFLIPKAIPIF